MSTKSFKINLDFLFGLFVGIAISIGIYTFIKGIYGETILILILLVLMIFIYLTTTDEERERDISYALERLKDIFL